MAEQQQQRPQMAEQQRPQMADPRSVEAQRATAEAREEAERKQLDETEPGGKYLATDGKTFVNAEGEPLNG